MDIARLSELTEDDPQRIAKIRSSTAAADGGEPGMSLVLYARRVKMLAASAAANAITQRRSSWVISLDVRSSLVYASDGRSMHRCTWAPCCVLWDMT